MRVCKTEQNHPDLASLLEVEALDTLSQLVRRLATIRSNYEAAERLRLAGFRVALTCWNPHDLHVHIRREDVRRAHAALGRLRFSAKMVASVALQTVAVLLRPVDYPGVTLTYTVPLTPSSRWRIETTETYTLARG